MIPFDKPVYVARPVLPDRKKYFEMLDSVWASQQLTNHGSLHNALEARLSESLGVPGLSLVNNGTIGLLIALRALDIREGEVITTPFTFPATPHAISWNGLDIVFCDIRPDTYCIDPEKIEEKITDKTRAILGVHVFGFPCDVEKIQAIADRYGLKVIYDAAHAFMTTIQDKPVSAFGDVSVFSFHATKLFHCVEGGALAYSDPALRKAIYLLRNFGIQNEETVVDVGINGKMNELQAAMGLLNIDLVENERARRQEIYNVYSSELAGVKGIILPVMTEGVTNSLQYFPVRIVESETGVSRDFIYNELKKYNIFARKYFYPLCSDYDPYTELASSSPDNLPVANQVQQEILCLPFYGDMGVNVALKISHCIKALI